MSILAISVEERQKALELHNEARRQAPGGPRPDLVWSNTLSTAAEEWGKKMVGKMWHQGNLEHDPRLRQKPYTMGENLFGGEGGRITLSTAVRGWIREKAYYNGGSVTANGLGKNGEKVGHYTQIIWPKTTKVGMAKIKSGDWIYIVARYDGPQVIGGLPWGGAKHLPPRHDPEPSPQDGPSTPLGGLSKKLKPTMGPPEQEIQRILDLHNEARREAPGGPRPDLVWSDTLAVAAEQWAKELARRNKGLEHDQQRIMGENLAMSEYEIQSFASAVRGWIREKRYYHGEPVGEENKSKEEQIGHYTQIIYQPVTKVGMARVTRGNKTYIVARYDEIQMRGTRPWGSTTHFPTKTIKEGQDSSRTQHSRHAPESSRMRRHRRSSTSRHTPRGETSLLEDIIVGIPRVVIKFPKISFRPSGRKRTRSR